MRLRKRASFTLTREMLDDADFGRSDTSIYQWPASRILSDAQWPYTGGDDSAESASSADEA